MRCEIKSGGWESSPRYCDPDAIQIVLLIWKGKGPPSPGVLVAFAVYCFMACVCHLGRTGLEAVTSVSVNRSWRAMKGTFLSDPQKQCLGSYLSFVSLQLFPIRGLRSIHCPVTELMVALVLQAQPHAFSAFLWVRPALCGADVEIVSDKSGETILPGCLLEYRVRLFDMSLKKLWRQMPFLKGRRDFSKISVNGLL